MIKSFPHMGNLYILFPFQKILERKYCIYNTQNMNNMKFNLLYHQKNTRKFIYFFLLVSL